MSRERTLGTSSKWQGMCSMCECSMSGLYENDGDHRCDSSKKLRSSRRSKVIESVESHIYSSQLPSLWSIYFSSTIVSKCCNSYSSLTWRDYQEVLVWQHQVMCILGVYIKYVHEGMMALAMPIFTVIRRPTLLAPNNILRRTSNGISQSCPNASNTCLPHIARPVFRSELKLLFGKI